ncbi:MAG: hypothetical protein ACLFSN_03265 [Candidatus Woesearchaeota archaeon]
MGKKLLFGIALAIFLVLGIGVVSAASYWVDDPGSCPDTNESVFSGQSCSPDEICGDNGGTAQCYDTDTLTPPSGTGTANVDVGLGGGYVVDCFAPDDGSGAGCDNDGNFWCNSDPSCSGVNRITVCNASTWSHESGSFSCGSCESGYTYCDGSYTDGDGCEIDVGTTEYPDEPNAHYNSTCSPECDSGYLDCDDDLGTGGTGCEVEEGSSCTADGDVSGQWVDCDCVPDSSFFETGVKSSYASSDPLLWGEEKGAGFLMNLTNSSGSSFSIDQNACIEFPDGSTQCSASSSGGDSGAGWSNSSAATTETSLNVDVDSGTLFVNSSSGRVGIGTDSPGSQLDVRGSGDFRGNLVLGNGSTTPSLLFRPSDDSSKPSIKHELGDGFIYNTKSGEAHNFMGGGSESVLYIEDEGNVGIGTDAPSEKLEVSDGSKGVTIDPDQTEPTIGTSGSSDVKITSSGGSVIIQLG